MILSNHICIYMKSVYSLRWVFKDCFSQRDDLCRCENRFVGPTSTLETNFHASVGHHANRKNLYKPTSELARKMLQLAVWPAERLRPSRGRLGKNWVWRDALPERRKKIFFVRYMLHCKELLHTRTGSLKSRSIKLNHLYVGQNVKLMIRLQDSPLENQQCMQFDLIWKKYLCFIFSGSVSKKNSLLRSSPVHKAVQC